MFTEVLFAFKLIMFSFEIFCKLTNLLSHNPLGCIGQTWNNLGFRAKSCIL